MIYNRRKLTKLLKNIALAQMYGSFMVLVFLILGFQVKKSSFDLQGTIWRYYSNGEYNGYTIQFSHTGLLVTSHPLDSTPNNDGWEQKGRKVKFWYNDHYATYEGKIINSSLIKGKATNIENETWQWELRREPIEQPSMQDSLIQ